MPEPYVSDSSPSFTREEDILIASCLFAAFLLFWVVADLSELHREILSVAHYSEVGVNAGLSVLSKFKTSYFLRLEILYVLANILRIAVWLVGAHWFYRCGPWIYRFFNVEESSHSS